MEFVDTTTPSDGRQYWYDIQHAPDRPFWNTKEDWQVMHDWAAMYYQNAYNTAMLNYQNEYNSPLQQMLRYQEAGLNPFLAGQDAGNMGSAPSGAAPRGSVAQGNSPVEIMNAITNGINGVSNSLKSAQQIYDYINFGRDISAEQKQLAHFNANLAQYRALGEEAETAWKRYWNLGEKEVPEVSTDPTVQTSPRAVYMESSTERISSQVNQLKALVNVLYPSQAAANDAREALTLYQKEILQGQKDAILQIKTGNETADAILKMVCFWLLGK